MLTDGISIKGHVIAELRDSGDEIKSRIVVPNLVTQNGRFAYAAGFGQLSGMGGTPQDPVYGMQLGTGSTVVTQTGTGSAIVSYISGSNQPLVSGWPQVQVLFTTVYIRWKVAWEAGEATSSTIREVAMVTTSADSAATSGETVSRALFPSALDKQATDTLTIVWVHAFNPA